MEKNLKSPKNYFWSLLKTVLLIGFILSALEFYLVWQNRFPAPQSPKEMTYQWEYQHQNYTLDETLYLSIDQYYAHQEKGILTGQEESSIDKYLNFPKKDQTIIQVAINLEALGKAKNLTQDQMAEMTLSFVQAIPYDVTRAQTDLTHPRYPYETLYEDLGICSDKSLLYDALVRQEGFGTAIFLFPQDEHMAVGVECSAQYSSYNSGYCFAETTASGNKIGLIPELKANSQASALETLPSYNTNQSVTSGQELSNPQIIAKTNGATYGGIVATIELSNKITALKQSLSQENTQINSDEGNLKNLGTALDGYKSIGDIAIYNANIPAYNSLLAKVQSEISTYNNQVDQYNQLITEYN